MDATLMPFIPDVQPPIMAPQSPGNQSDAAKTKTGETFGGILTTSLNSLDSGKTADTANLKTAAEPTVNLVSLMGLLTLTTIQQPLFAECGKTVVGPNQLAVDTVAALTSSKPNMPQSLPTFPAVGNIPTATVNGLQNESVSRIPPRMLTLNNALPEPTVSLSTATITPKSALEQQSTVMPTVAQAPVTPQAVIPQTLQTTQAAVTPQATPTATVIPTVSPNAVEQAQAVAQTPTTAALSAALGISAEQMTTEKPKIVRQNTSAQQDLILTNVAPTQPPTAITVASMQTPKHSLITPVGAGFGQNDANAATISAGEAADSQPSLLTQEPPVNNSAVFAGILEQRSANPAHTAQTSMEVPQQAGPDPYNVAGQIVDNARLITRTDNTEMVIKLKPEHLGELTMKIAVANGTVSATFHSANPDVRGALEASLIQLKQELSNQGLKVNYVGVYTSLDQFSSNDQRGNLYQHTSKNQTKNRDSRGFVDTVESLSAISQPTAAAAGIDYRI